MKIVSLCNTEVRIMLKYWGMVKEIDNSETQIILGINFIPVERSVPEMVETLLENGYVPD